MIEENTSCAYGVPAIYRSVQKYPEFVGNPLVEALPPIIDNRTAMKFMSYRPHFSEEERQEPKEVRAHYIKRLSRLVQPVESHLKIEQALSINLRYGYVTKNPLIPATIQHQHYLRERGADGVELPPIEFISSAMFLTGYSG
ncbi:hypothetical protein L0244_13730, partial [bacterium]|nr:hypothetical protein [bacterium]